jgi:hypothetical protein
MEFYTPCQDECLDEMRSVECLLKTFYGYKTLWIKLLQLCAGLVYGGKGGAV